MKEDGPRTYGKDRRHIHGYYCYTCAIYFDPEDVKSKYDHEEHQVINIPEHY